MSVHFSQAQCRALVRTFGSWDWSPGGLSGGEACRTIISAVNYGGQYGQLGARVDVSCWGEVTVRLFATLVKATIAPPDHSHGCETQYREWPPKHVREALACRLNEVYLACGISVVDMLAEVGRE